MLIWNTVRTFDKVSMPNSNSHNISKGFSAGNRIEVITTIKKSSVVVVCSKEQRTRTINDMIACQGSALGPQRNEDKSGLRFLTSTTTQKSCDLAWES